MTSEQTSIKYFLINPINLNRWMQQNKAEYTGDFLDGCLLDNFVVKTKRGYAAVYEKYVNEGMSTYRIEWQAGNADNVFANWYMFEQNCFAEQ
jgi:hypothetical protein